MPHRGGNQPDISRQRKPLERKGGRMRKHERGGRDTNEVGGSSAAAAGGDGLIAKAPNVVPQCGGATGVARKAI